ncbi:type I restriction endonuclease subunit R [Fodinibius sp. SL11]|uniref:type I restriction endonuclease subunit R n=1 Tax=Fodinibius sp. SL11 TaxID=3425690 RepID=UPI003F883779
MSQQIREQYLEEDIENVLLQEQVEGDRVKEEGKEYTVAGQPGGYCQRTTEDYDKSLCLIPKDVIDFIKATQPKEWRKYKDIVGEDAEDELLKEVKKKIDRRGTIFVFRNVLRASGCRFKLTYFKPNTSLNPELQKKYKANFFSVVRQLKYSEENENSLDMGIFLNGLPIFTVELKNPMNGQDVKDAIAQYKDDRESHEPIFQFKRCLAHFAVDPEEVYYTTKLEGYKSYFLPFNKGKQGGAGNPTPMGDEDKYATSYLWEKIWSKDSVLNLIQHFVHTMEETETDPNTGKEKTKETLFFPRYHQLKAVRRMVNHAKEHGTGQRYLVQHSAGSGKSNTIAWLGHQLSSLHDATDEKVFDTVIVITDRRVLDRQLRDIVLEFQKERGLVEPIGDEDTSEDLKEALRKGKKIITTTLQKFPYITEAMKDYKGANFAVLIDEAHSSMAGSTTRQMNEVLSPVSLDEAEDTDDVEPEDLFDHIERLVQSRGQLPNVSYFAFTATPKEKTLELFGTEQPDGSYEPFSLYTMRQAIEEDFIIDVLENYTTYNSYFKLLKSIEDDPKYDQGKASAMLKKFVSLHEHAINEKAKIIVDHFHQFVSHAIAGKGKAMVVTRSRLHAVRFGLAIKKIIGEENYPYKVLTAFSGTVKDPETGKEYTESGMNGVPQTQTKDQFKKQDYRFMVVANKFQTGFDQPLLHTMYVDKKLGGVNAVQTLSRLNRTHPQKQGTMVLDFANEAQDIQHSFSNYYEKTFLSEGTDQNVLYNLMEDLEEYRLYSEVDIDQFAEHYFSKNVKQVKLQNILVPIADRFNELGEDEQRDFYRKLRKYVRTYSFLSQILPFDDVPMEKFYAFGKYLLRLISLDESKLPREVLQEVDMDSYRIQRMFKGDIDPKRGGGELKPGDIDGETSGSNEAEESLSEIIRVINDRYGTDFSEDDKVFTAFRDRLYRDEAVQKSAEANTKENAKITFEDKAREHAREMIDEHFGFYKKFNDDDDFRDALVHMLFNDFQSWMQEKSS